MADISATVKNNELIYVKIAYSQPGCQYDELWFTQTMTGDLTFDIDQAKVLNIIKVNPALTTHQQASTTFEDLQYGNLIYLSAGPAGSPCFGNWSGSTYGYFDTASSQSGWKQAQWLVARGPQSTLNPFVVPGENIYLQSVSDPNTYMFYDTFNGKNYIRLKKNQGVNLISNIQLIPLRPMFFISSTQTGNACACKECPMINPLVYMKAATMIIDPKTNLITRQVLDPNATPSTQKGIWVSSNCGPNCPGLGCFSTIPFVNATEYITPYNDASSCCNIQPCPSGYNCSSVGQMCKDKQNKIWTCQTTPRPADQCSGPCWNIIPNMVSSSFEKNQSQKTNSSLLWIFLFLIIILLVFFMIKKQKK